MTALIGSERGEVTCGQVTLISGEGEAEASHYAWGLNCYSTGGKLVIFVVVVAGISLPYSYQHCAELFGAGQVSERHEEKKSY